MNNEVVDFAENIGAVDLKHIFDDAGCYGMFKHKNYYQLKDKFLIVKISRSKEKPFWGMGQKFFDFFNKITEIGGNYYFVALDSNKSGWILSKSEIVSKISDGSLSYSYSQKQYKINMYNLNDSNRFSSIDGFLNIIQNIK